MSADACVARAAAAGVSLAASKGELRVRWPKGYPPPPELLADLRAHKAEIIARLLEAAREVENERAAIMEIDSGLPRDWAEALAAICAGPRPQACPRADWPALCDDVLRFADRHGATLAALGWGFDEMFGAPAHWARLDQTGIGWFVRGGRIVHADAASIKFEREGARYTHARPARP